jgi:hypothetical protein
VLPVRLLFFLDGCRRRVPGRQDFKDFAIFFCLQLFNYCIITYNYRMIALGKIPEAVGSDLLIGFCGFFTIKLVADSDKKSRWGLAGYVLGGGFGTISGIVISKVFHFA